MRLKHAGLRTSRIAAVFITHLHGDHYFGLLGLMSSMALMRHKDPLVVVAPEELTRVMHLLPNIRDHELTYPVELVPLPACLSHAVVYDTPEFFVEARALAHRVFTVGYRIQEKARPGRLDVKRAGALGIVDYTDYQALKRGQPVKGPGGRLVQPDAVLAAPKAAPSFAYVADTSPCEGGVLLARGATLLMHEATFAGAMQARARATGHSTAAEAAAVAKKAGAGKLLLTHFSSRYKDVEPLVEEARAVFPATEAAQELERYTVVPTDG